MQLTACSTASPTNRADGDLVRRTGKDWPGDRHSWPLRTSAAHRGSARASEAVPEAHFSGLLPDFRSPGSEPGATRVLGCISAVAWGLCRTCQVLDVNPPLTCGKLGSCTRHALVLKDARTLSPPRVCVPALPSPQGSETVAGESTLPARPRAGVSRTQPRSGQRRAGRAAGQCLRRGRRAHPLVARPLDTVMHFTPLFLVSWRHCDSERLLHIMPTQCLLQPGGFQEDESQPPLPSGAQPGGTGRSR